MYILTMSIGYCKTEFVFRSAANAVEFLTTATEKNVKAEGYEKMEITLKYTEGDEKNEI